MPLIFAFVIPCSSARCYDAKRDATRAALRANAPRFEQREFFRRRRLWRCQFFHAAGASRSSVRRDIDADVRFRC